MPEKEIVKIDISKVKRKKKGTSKEVLVRLGDSYMMDYSSLFQIGFTKNVIITHFFSTNLRPFTDGMVFIWYEL